MLQMRDIAESVLPVSRIDIVCKAQRGYSHDRSNPTYFLWIYLRQRKEYISLDYGEGEEAVKNRNDDIAAIKAESQNQGL